MIIVIRRVIMIMIRLTRQNWTTSEVGWRKSVARSTTSRFWKISIRAWMDVCRLMIELQILIAFSVQDKILHIAKVAEAAKTENLNLSESCRNPSPYETATNYDHHHVQRTSWLQMLELKTQEFRTSPTRSACSLR